MDWKVVIYMNSKLIDGLEKVLITVVTIAIGIGLEYLKEMNK